MPMYTIHNSCELIAVAIILSETDAPLPDFVILCDSKILTGKLLEGIYTHLTRDHKSHRDVLPLNDVCVGLASFAL